MLALVYIDRIIKTNYSFAVSSLNVHRLLIVSVMLAAKFFDDQYYNNAYYAQIGGVSCEEINSLEVEFLFMINFSLYVSRETYDQYINELTKHFYSGCPCQAVRTGGVHTEEPSRQREAQIDGSSNQKSQKVDKNAVDQDAKSDAGGQDTAKDEDGRSAKRRHT